MAYNPYSAVNAIYNLKGQWDNANNANDAEKKNQAAARAQAYYNQLRNNGYANIADELSASNYAQAKSTRDKWAKMGKTATRPHLYTLGKKYGMSQNDVDKLIGWDDSTGQISFGGKNIGTPDTVVDGTSYWSDTSTLDNAFRDYITRSGTVRAKDASVNQENESLFKKYNQEYEDLKNTNPFETETAKSILAKYDLAGLQGRDNAVASGAGSNGGNIDSFAAANALRQQASLVNQGQQAVLSAHQQKLDHAKALLSDMGVNIDRVFNQDETAKNNDTTRKSTMASVSGYTPSDWTIQNDAFLKNFVDDNGKLKSEYYNTDFQDLINKAKASGNADLANKYAILRGLKIFGDFTNYGKYLNEGDVSYVKPNRTADYDLTKQQIDSAERISKANNETSLAATNAELASNERIADKEAQNAKDLAAIQAKNALDQLEYNTNYGTQAGSKPSLTAAQAASAIKNGEKSQSVIDAYNYWYGTNYTIDNPPNLSGTDASWASDGDAGSSSDTDYEKALNTVYEKSSKTVRDYIRNELEPLVTQSDVTETELKNHLINNSQKYDLEVKDIKGICEALGVDSKWVDNYKNKGLFGWGNGVKER